MPLDEMHKSTREYAFPPNSLFPQNSKPVLKASFFGRGLRADTTHINILNSEEMRKTKGKAGSALRSSAGNARVRRAGSRTCWRRAKQGRRNGGGGGGGERNLKIYENVDEAFRIEVRCLRTFMGSSRTSRSRLVIR